MEEKTTTRKLTTIFYADVVGYSRLTGSDELGTHQAVMDLLDLAQQTIQQAGGKVLRYAGDAILAEFSSVVSCVNAAIQVQTHQASPCPRTCPVGCRSEVGTRYPED